METGLRLAGEYVKVKRLASEEFTYGGDQGFFAGAESGSEDERKEKSGCGIIALCDVLLYLANRDMRFAIAQNKCYVNRTLRQEEYQEYYNSIYKYLGRIPMKGGISGIKLQIGFNRLARKQKWNLRSRWALSGRKLYGRITEMLQRDLPVILCIPMLLRKKDKQRMLSFYQKKGDRFEPVLRTSAHYVTVTGAVLQEKTVFLEISSWGKKYYMKWDEYEEMIHTVFLGILLGNILYIKEKNKLIKGQG